MTARYEAPGLSADWLNGWLAAVGITVLIPAVRLAWTNDAVPHAIFEIGDVGELVAALAAGMPTPETLATSTIARTLPNAQEQFARNVTLPAFRERAALERSLSDGQLTGCVSDLREPIDPTSLDHGAFDPPAPRGETLWSRALACAKELQRGDVAARIDETLQGVGRRSPLNGLGFDPRRLPAGLHAQRTLYVDPVVELLAFAALRLFPTRGDGTRIRQRGWHGPASQRGAFEWFAWMPSLDRWAIDALLDQPVETTKAYALARYRVVPLVTDPKDPTRAYFAERAQ